MGFERFHGTGSKENQLEGSAPSGQRNHKLRTAKEERNMEQNTVEEVIEDLRAGKLIVCIDDPDRENEGDLICAA